MDTKKLDYLPILHLLAIERGMGELRVSYRTTIVCMVVVRPSLRELDDGGGAAAVGGELGVVGVEGAGGVAGVEATFALELEPSSPLGLLNVAVSSGSGVEGNVGVAMGVAGNAGLGDRSLGGGGGQGSKPSTGIGIPSFNALFRFSRACFSILCDSSSPSHVPSSGTVKCSSGMSPRLGSP